ncbi:unnamed protein product [Phaedon cochleariae]|uniref:Uncharacterized protein n=1 Tax=Phaedon cochleariae TaxID=80249 RepID=A0A9P0DHW8_PHACE|nr:unnamed protein product [Phaedon cochleariae]
MESLTFLLAFLPLALTEVNLLLPREEISTPPPPPRPYAFGYAAGRYPGHIDRTHSEVSDGSGIVHGSYSYVDPSQRIRTVEYTADKNGFHPSQNFRAPDLPSDTPVVAAAKANHLRRFEAIAHAHQAGPNRAVVPAETKAVQGARERHLALYEKIAEEHRRRGAELEAIQRAEDAQKAELGNGLYI